MAEVYEAEEPASRSNAWRRVCRRSRWVLTKSVRSAPEREGGMRLPVCARSAA